MKECLTLLAITKMQIEIKMKYHYTPTRMAIFFEKLGNQVLGEYRATGTRTRCW